MEEHDPRKYDIVKQELNQSVVGRGEPNVIRQKVGLFGRSYTMPLAGALLVSGACFAYAHHVWKTKDHEKEEEYLNSLKAEQSEKQKLTPEERQERVSKVVFGTPINKRGYVQFSHENQELNKDAGSFTKVDINEEYKRVEIYKQGLLGYRVIEVHFDNIVKDEKGNLTFHENGEPVIKKFISFLPSHYEIEQWFNKFF